MTIDLNERQLFDALMRRIVKAPGFAPELFHHSDVLLDMEFSRRLPVGARMFIHVSPRSGTHATYSPQAPRDARATLTLSLTRTGDDLSVRSFDIKEV